MQPRPKYQVFISSTYRDLHEERERVTWGILNARHIPAGMENFTATTDRGWETICRVIDLSDYYVVILAGLYGSIDDSTGMSWTQREYEYAVQRHVPVLGFIRDEDHITQNKAEQDAPRRQRLLDFKATLRQQHMVQMWTDGDDLARKVVEAIRNHIVDDEDAERARPGWYRGDKIFLPSNVAQELARLSAENEALRQQVENLKGVKSVAFELLDEHDAGIVDELAVTSPWLVLEPKDEPQRAADSWAMRANLFEVPWEKQKGYVDRLNRSVEVMFKLKNSGTKAARDVVVDLEFDACESVDLGRPARPRSEIAVGVSSALVGPLWKVNAKEHVYIDQRGAKNGIGTVRQRIKGIAPGVSEKIVPFWITVTTATRTGWSARCSYCITDSEGAQLKGSFCVNVRLDKGRIIRSLDELDEKDE
jgi:hypothetical protein